MTATREPRSRLVALAVAGVVALWSAQADSQEIVLKTGTSWNDKFPMAEMLNGVLKPKLAEYSNGRLGMDVHLAGSLCNEKTCVEQVKLGQADIGTASVSNYGGFHKTYEILTLPYIFTNDAAAQSVLDGFLFETLGKISVEQDKMKILAVVPLLGFRQLETNVGTVRTPADLRGVKIRVTKSPLDGALIRAWGAVATPVAWAETYDAVQQKVVRGLYIQKPVHAMMKFYEVAPNVTLTGGAWTPMIIFMSLDRYNKLPGWAQEAVDKAAKDLRGQTFAIDARYAAKMGSANIDKIEYYQPTPEEMSQWHKAAAQAWLVGKKLKLYDPALARRILEAQDGIEALIGELAAIGAIE
jgi:TRAP-type C4-dicarboxylate transport system substrate-binding protein